MSTPETVPATGAERVRPRDVVTSPERRDEYLANGRWTDHTLPDRVAEHARRAPDSPAVIDQRGTRRKTYAELDRDASRIANHLIGSGIEPGDVVSIQLPNWYETVAVDVGVLRAGAVMNPLLPNYREKELRHVLGVAGVKVLFTPERYRRFDHSALADHLVDTVDELEQKIVVDDPVDGRTRFATWLDGLPNSTPPRRQGAEAVSELIFTSGTEAQPKAIMHTEQTTNFSARAVSSSLGVGADDVVWMPSPIGHSTGFNYGVRVALYHGLPLVLQDQWDAEDAVRLIEECRCSYSIVATTFVSDVCEIAARRPCDLSSMRLFGSGGAPIPPEVVTAAQGHGMNVLRLYGSTELLMATTNRPGDPMQKLIDTDGRALDHIQIQIRDDEERVVTGAPGEILARGPNTCVGFYNDPSRTAATFAGDGWVRSGDLGVLDEDGFLAIVGRKKEIIIRGGLNIAPREIEDLVVIHPAVADAAVIGLPHPRLGEMTCACVVLRPGAELSLETLTAFLKDDHGMATFKLPQRLEIVDALPKTPTGKVRKFELVNHIKQNDKEREQR